MKYITIGLFMLLMGFSANAKKFKGYYVTHSLDTVECQILAGYNTYKMGGSNYFIDLCRRLRIKDSEGKKTFRPYQIASFFIAISDDEGYKFISLAENINYFFLEIISGEISLYRVDIKDIYGVPKRHVFMGKGQKIMNLSAQINRRKKAAAFFEDKPSIAAKLEESKFRYDFLEELINEYNNLPSN